MNDLVVRLLAKQRQKKQEEYVFCGKTVPLLKASRQDLKLPAEKQA